MKETYEMKREQLVRELEIEGYEESTQLALINMLANYIWQGIQQCIIKELPADKAKVFTEMLQQSKHEEAENYAKKNIPEYEVFLQKANKLEAEKVIKHWHERDKTKVFPPLLDKK